MRICLICEGCYPYIPGGVSNWIQTLCTYFSDIEFVIWSIATTEEEMSEVVYQLPKNIKDMRTIYIGEHKFEHKYKDIKLKKKEKDVFQSFLLRKEKNINWKDLSKLLKKYRNHIEDLVMSREFYKICLEKYHSENSQKTFLSFLWNCRNMFFPLLYVLSRDIPDASIYHAVSTGYAGILGSYAASVKEKPFLLSEHGIYTREREEDIIRSQYIKGDFKQDWIDFFLMLSNITYDRADQVTSLFEVNRTLQVEIGCPIEKITMIPNGVDVDAFSNLKSEKNLPNNQFNIGAVLRVVPIKDVKTMILSFAMVQEKYSDMYLYIMGNCEEDIQYCTECEELIKEMKIPNVIFLGQVNIKEYLSDIKILLLSSISEGQPLAMLEGMAAGIPFVATNVGDCKELMDGSDKDPFGRAGIVVPVMDSEKMAKAIEYLYKNPKDRERMGKAGKNRVSTYYKKEDYLEKYRKLYERFGK